MKETFAGDGDAQRDANLVSNLLLAEKQVAMSLLMAGFAHDAGTPLMAIASITQLLAEKYDDPFLKEKMSQIRLSTDRLAQILRTMVDFSRAVRPEREKVYLNAVILEAARIVKHDRRLKYREVITNLEPRIPQVLASADQMLQLFIFLALNAATAMESAPQGSLTFSSWQEGEWVMAGVADEGAPAGELTEEYSPLMAVSGSAWDLAAAHYVVRQLVALHGGRVERANDPEKGNRVVIALPALTDQAGA